MTRYFKLSAILWLVSASLVTGTLLSSVESEAGGGPATRTGTTPDPCAQMPCGSGSTCEPLFNGSYGCTCLPGQMYNYRGYNCMNAKVFPGRVTLTETFNESLENKLSEEFWNLTMDTVLELHNIYNDTTGFLTATLERFQQIPNTRVWSRNTGNVQAVVEIFFEEAATITEDKVKETFTDNMDSAVFQPNSKFEAEKLCDRQPCDAETTKCSSANGIFTCDCLDGYSKTDYSTRLCIGRAGTTCPDGEEHSDQGCVKCSFGYSGFNCRDSWQLWLAIVGSALGGLLLISILVLTVLLARSPKKHRDDRGGKGGNYSSKAPVDNNMGAPSSRHAAMNGTASGFAYAGPPTYPEAPAFSSLDYRTNMEMAPSNRHQNLPPAGRNMHPYDDFDDMSPYSRSTPQRSYYDQTQPQTNPYGQNRPQNPYASPNQGYNNPYYTNDNGTLY